MLQFNVGDAVRKEERVGVSWKIGTVVEIGEGNYAGRIRVRWSKQCWKHGDKDGSREDGKRTWVAANVLTPIQSAI